MRIVERLKTEPDLKVRLAGGSGGATGKSGRDLALARALAVQRFLVSKGAPSSAIKVDPVAVGEHRDGVAVRLIFPA